MEDLKNELDQFRIITDALLIDEKERPVSELIEADELFEKMDLSLNDNGLADDQFYNSLKDLVLKTPKTASSHFFNQLFGGRQNKAVLGDLLAVILNNSMYTYKVAGPQVGIEKEIIQNVAAKIGYNAQYGGTIAAGGSMNNFMALVMARDKFNSDIKSKGVCQNLIAYSSKDSHYSNAKNASFAGIGKDNVRYIPTNDQGQMIPSEFEKAVLEDLSNGNNPFFLNATAATTVYGAYDPINELADICEKYNIWLHIDGAYGGAVLFSEKYKYLIDGAHRANSFAFNAHKMLGTPLSCSILLVKDKSDLDFSFSNDASYLYQTHDDDFNPGKTSFQCGRRNDALKLWTLWKSVGSKGLEKIVDHQFHLADIAREYVSNNADYQLYGPKNSVSVCFNYLGIDPKILCSKLYEDGELVVGYGEFDGVEFVRFVTINANNSEKEILDFFSMLEKYVEENQEFFLAQSESKK